MKQKVISYFLTLCLLLGLIPGSAFAASTVLASGTCGAEGNESSLTWALDSDGILTISGTGEMRDYGYSSMGGTAPWNNEDNPYGSQIKQVIVESGVTKIGWCAFLGCYNLHSIKLSDTVTKFDGGALFGGEWTDGASSLVNIDVDPNNQVYTSVDGVVFTKDMTTLVSFPAKKSDKTYEIPESVTEIAPYAFVYSTLQEIDIPDSVNKIGDLAFSDCGELTSITIPESVTEVGSYAFNYCWNLSDISLPNGTTTIPDGMFYGCYALTKITIPISVVSIGWGAFNACTALRHVYYSGSEADWNKISIEDANDPLLSANIHFQETQPESAIVGFYPANNARVDQLDASMIRIGFDRDVLSGQVKDNYADLDFTKAPLSLYRASDDALIYQVTEYEDDGISFDVTSFSSSPTEVNIRIINAESLIVPGNAYYVTMGAGFIKFADGTVSPEIKKGDWNFTTSYYSKTIDIQMNTGSGDSSTSISTLWDESWFTNPATTYMHDLAVTSMVLSGAAYNEQSIKSALQNLGFTGAETNEVITQNFDYPLTETDNDIVAYTFGQKTFYDEAANPYTLIVIAIKGTSGNEEWFSNFNIGTDPTHRGFQLASKDLLDNLAEFRKKVGANGENVKYLVTGHSRGAAVANLVAAELTKAGIVKKENIYAYTFATPTVSRYASETGYENIFNIVNAEDFVTRVPLTSWGYSRYGIDLVLPSRSFYNSNYYDVIYKNMTVQFTECTGKKYEPYNGTSDVDYVVYNLNNLAPSPEKYYSTVWYADYRPDGSSVRLTTSDYFNNLAAFLVSGQDLKYLPTFLAPPFLTKVTPFFLMNENKLFPRIFSTHCQAAYYSWLATCNPGELFGYFNEKSIQTFKRLVVKCPVDVFIYNETGTLVSSVVNESVETNILATNLSDGMKMIDLPGDQTYSIKIVAYDSGTVDYTIEELAAKATGTDVLRTVEFYKIPIETSDELTGTIDEAHSIESSQYALTKNDQDKIYADYDSAQQDNASSGGNVSSTPTRYAIKLSDDIAGGTIYISETKAAKGEKVTITVHPDSDYQLDTLSVTTRSGVSVELTAIDSGEYQFIMPASNVTISVTFVKIPAKNTFDDVGINDYYYDAVLWAVEQSITNGISATTFGPDIDCTRSQVVAFLWRAAGSPAPKSNTMPFLDVPPDAYYHDAVLWAVEQGITSGTTESTFSPDLACTRSQVVTFLWRTAGSPKAEKVDVQFSDVPSDEYYSDAVLWAVEHKITSGTSASTFGPLVNCTRAQIVTFLWRCYAK